jgi:hypothetical protein
MHAHRNGGPPDWLPAVDSVDWRAQRLVLLELVASPPPEGDDLRYLRHVLDVPAVAIEPAVAALEAIGLARLNRSLVMATPPALYFEHLWPVRP